MKCQVTQKSENVELPKGVCSKVKSKKEQRKCRSKNKQYKKLLSKARASKSDQIKKAQKNIEEKKAWLLKSFPDTEIEFNEDGEIPKGVCGKLDKSKPKKLKVCRKRNKAYKAAMKNLKKLQEGEGIDDLNERLTKLRLAILAFSNE